MNWFKIHQDYDKLKEPARMFIGLYFMLPFFLGLAFMGKNPAWAIGILFVGIMTIYRIIYIWLGDNNEKGD